MAKSSRAFLAAASGLVVLVACHARRLEPLTIGGTWEGGVTVRGKIRGIVLTLSETTAGFSGSVTIPDEYALDDPIGNLKYEAGKVEFELPDEIGRGKFAGTLERGRIFGRFTGEQDGDPLEGTFELWRRPPKHESYRTEEVSFRGGEGTLAGTLFLPAGAGPHPAIVFYHGSGPQTRDSYVRHFAARFAREGVAALIYDKRGTGASEGASWMRSTATFDDLAKDGLGGVALLSQRRDIIPARIGVWGLSQGAWLAPLATAQSPNVAFVVILSGGGVSPAEQELYDDEVKLKALGYSEDEIADAIGVLKQADDFVREATDARWEKVQAALDHAKQQPWFRFLDKFPLVLPREAWWHGADLDYDPAPTLRKLAVPFFVVLGQRDMSTPTEETARRIRDALREGGGRDATITVVPGADHALQIGPDPWPRLRQAGEGGSPSTRTTASWDWKRPAPGWEDSMTAWVVATARAKRP